MTTTSFGGNDGQTNNTTPVTVATAPGSGVQRQVKSLQVSNHDTVSATVAVNYIDGANTRVIGPITLAPGETLQCNENDLYVLDSTSKSMSVSLAVPVTTNQLDWVVCWCDMTNS